MQQHAFANHLRDPESFPPPQGVDARRLAVYRELFSNNMEGLLSGNFPVIRQILGSNWTALVRAFYARHRCQTPLFTRIGEEFVAWLQQNEYSQWPWLAELAHYEWIELALHTSDVALPAHDPQGDLSIGIPIVSPYAIALAYAWPVHRIGPDRVPVALPDTATLLLARRTAQGEIRFAELSPGVYRLLELLQAAPTTGHAALVALAGELASSDRAHFMRQGMAMLQRLQREGTLLGTAVES